MPPRTSLTNFAVTDANNEVVCPLRNQDGTSCRKRCFGEKRFRSMQEHIRRAHPDHYIPKLPATEESFLLMVNTLPNDRPPQAQQQQQQQQQQRQAQQAPPSRDSNHFNPNAFDPTSVNNFFNASPASNRPTADFRRPSFIPAANAAAALAQLHNSRPPDNEWDAEGVGSPPVLAFEVGQPDVALMQETFVDTDQPHNYFAGTDPQNLFSNDPQQSLDSVSLANALNTPTNRANFAALRARINNRARKSSIAEDARKPKHEREKSKDHKRLSADLNKRFSAEPGKRWEDLLDAAASATEEDSRELTPIPQSPRGSLPPFHNQNHNQFQSYNTSPLQNTVLPQSPEPEPNYQTAPLEPFPSVEDSAFETSGTQQQQQPYHQHQGSTDEAGNNNPYVFQPRHQAHPSGSNFHIPPEGLSSSPNDASALAHAHMRSFSGPSFPNAGPTQQPAAQLVQHYCAACHRVTPLTSSYACTECICGVCRDCCDVLLHMGPERVAACPNCGAIGSRFKPFMLDLR